MENKRLVSIWHAMHNRCYNKHVSQFEHYGARGIQVCKEWNRNNPDGLDNFIAWSLQHGYNDNLSIDRIDVNGDYKPSNCRWTDDITQARNTRECVKVTVLCVDYNSITEACEEYNLNYNTISQYKRKHGITWEQTLEHYALKQIVRVGDNVYHSAKECCDCLGFDYTQVQQYKKQNKCTWEEALHKQCANVCTKCTQCNYTPCEGYQNLECRECCIYHRKSGKSTPKKALF